MESNKKGKYLHSKKVIGLVSINIGIIFAIKKGDIMLSEEEKILGVVEPKLSENFCQTYRDWPSWVKKWGSGATR